MGRVYAVVSAKGGVGKTTTAANLAATLAAAGESVVVVDGDLGMANLASALGITVGDVTLHDVLAGDSEGQSASGKRTESGDVDAAIHEGPHGMAVVPGSPDLDAFSLADPEAIEGVLDELRADYEYVVLDTGAGLSNDTVVPLTYVDEVLLVSTPTRDALGDTDKTRQVADRLGVAVAGAVITRADPESVDRARVGDALGAEILEVIPDAAVIREASDAGEPVTTFAPGSAAATAYRALAAGLSGLDLLDDADDAADDAEGATAVDEDAEGATAVDEDAEGATAVDEDAEEASDGPETEEPAAPEAEERGSDAGETGADAQADDVVVAGSHEGDRPPETIEPAAEAAGDEGPDPDDAGDEGESTGTDADVDEIDDAEESEPIVEPATPDEIGVAEPDAESASAGEVYTTSLEGELGDDASHASDDSDDTDGDVTTGPVELADSDDEASHDGADERTGSADDERTDVGRDADTLDDGASASIEESDDDTADGDDTADDGDDAGPSDDDANASDDADASGDDDGAADTSDDDGDTADTSDDDGDTADTSDDDGKKGLFSRFFG